jgi:hypothetical protein
MIRFEKDDIIMHSKKEYRCIVCDNEIAAFGRFTLGMRTTFKDCFFVSNDIEDDGFKYEFLYNLKTKKP